jgi:osmotically-inducible protein OsmY
MINGLTNVTVSENQTTGIMTLAGSVRSQEEKAQAGQIARINAIDYKIVNNIAITQPAQANLDTGITDNYKDLLKANKILDGQNIDYKAESGVLVLSGTVHNARERAEAVRLAKSVANVKQVQDKIRVRP